VLHRPPYAVIACSVLFFWSISIRYLVYAMMPTIADDLRLSSSVAGLVIAGSLFGYCVGSWLAAWSPLCRKRTIIAGAFASLLGAALFPLSGSLTSIMVMGFVIGVGTGVYLPLGLTLLLEAGGSTRKGYYLSIHEMSASIASFTGASAVALLLQWTDWRGSILLWCIVGLIATFSFMLMQDKGEVPRMEKRSSFSVPIDLKLVKLLSIYAASTLVVMGLVSLLPLIMVRAWGVPQTEAASLVGSTRLAGLAGVIAVGFIADRWEFRSVLLVLQSFCLVGCLAMAFGGYGLLFQLGMAVMALGASANIGLVPGVIAGAYPAGQRQQAMAISNSVGGFMGMVASPALFGILLDWGFATGPLVLTAAAALLMLFLTRQMATKEG
jgi:predicted MFS family arabinose efflux permease